MGRRQFTVEEKFSIVEEARQPDTTIAEVCRRHGIAASVFYRWEAQMRNGAREGLAEKCGKRDGSRLRRHCTRVQCRLMLCGDPITPEYLWICARRQAERNTLAWTELRTTT